MRNRLFVCVFARVRQYPLTSIVILIFSILGNCTSLHAQQLTQQWVNRLDAPAGFNSVGAITADSKDNSYVTGNICTQLSSDQSQGCLNTELEVIKYDSKGNTVWTNDISNDQGFATGTAITVDSSGNVYAAGYGYLAQKASDGTPDLEFILAKYDGSGVQQWVKFQDTGGSAGGDPRQGPDAIAVDAEGNCYFAGDIGHIGQQVSPMNIVKYSPSGGQLWIGTVTTSAYPDFTIFNIVPVGLGLDSQANVYVSAQVGQQVATVKFDSNGKQLWLQTYGQPGSLSPFTAAGIAVDPAGNSHVAAWGGTLNNGQIKTPQNAYVITYGPAGDQLWIAQYQTAETSGNIVSGIALDKSGNSYITGLVGDGAPGSGIGGAPTDFDTIKFDANGKFVWEKRYNASGSDQGTTTNQRIVLDQAANVYVSGTATNSQNSNGEDFVTIKYDANGNQLSVATYNGPKNGNDTTVDMAFGSADLFVTGNSVGADFQSDWATIEYAQGPVNGINVSPTTLTFSSSVGTLTAAQSITVSNQSSATLAITAAPSISGAEAGDFAVAGGTSCTNGANVTSGASCSINVTFKPSATGSRSAALMIADSDSSGPQSVSLQGTGVSSSSPMLTFSPTSLSFPGEQVGSTSPSQNVTLTNSGSATLNISSISITGTNPSDFKTGATTCGKTLAAASNCVVPITFTPAAEGSRSATLSVADDLTGSPQTVFLSGEGSGITLVCPTNQTSATVNAGESATFKVNLTPTAFSGDVSITCNGAPAAANCVVSPASVSLNGNAPTPLTVSVTTTTRSSGLLPTVRFNSKQMFLIPVFAILVIGLFGFSGGTGRRFKPSLALIVLVLIASFGCGSMAMTPSNSSNSPPSSPSTTGTPAGTSTLTVTATSGSTKATLPLTLTVK
jgi:hypothetical protein